MRAFAALLLFELGRRRMLLIAGALLGITACLLPNLVSSTGAGDVRQAAALAFALSILGFGGLLVGTSFLAEDLGAKRYSFYFSAPVSGFSIFASRLVGAAGILLLSTLLALIPASLFEAFFAGGTREAMAEGRGAVSSALEAMPFMDDFPVVALLASMITILLLALGNALGLAGRARDAWIVVEIVSVLVLAGSLAASRDVLAIPRSVMFEEGVLPATVALFGLGFLVAAAIQTIAGRTDMSRARAAFALTTAVSSLAVGALCVVSSRSYALPELGAFRLSNLVSTHSYDDRWIELRVQRTFPEGLQLAYLVDRETRRSVLLGAEARYWQSDRPDSVQRTADGRYALWMKPDASGRNHRLFQVDLTSPDLLSTPMGLEIDGRLLDWKVSPDGSLVGTVSRIGTSRPALGPWEERGALQISVERADGTGTILTRRIPTEAAQTARVIDVSATDLRVIAVTRSSIQENDEIALVPWTTSSESCTQADSEFLRSHESPEFGRQLIEIDASTASSTARSRRRTLPDGWWDVTILASDRSNILLAGASGSVVILDRESTELVWCHASPVSNYYLDVRDVALALPDRKFAIRTGHRSDRSLMIIDDCGVLAAPPDLTHVASQEPRHGFRVALAGSNFIDYLDTSRLQRYQTVRRVELPSGRITETKALNERLDRSGLLFSPAQH